MTKDVLLPLLFAALCGFLILLAICSQIYYFLIDGKRPTILDRAIICGLLIALLIGFYQAFKALDI